MRFFPDIASRFGIIPRYGAPDSIRWFEAEPTYVLHWTNAYEDGDEIVLDGYFQEHPEPANHPAAQPGYAVVFVCRLALSPPVLSRKTSIQTEVSIRITLTCPQGFVVKISSEPNFPGQLKQVLFSTLANEFIKRNIQ